MVADTVTVTVTDTVTATVNYTVTVTATITVTHTLNVRFQSSVFRSVTVAVFPTVYGCAYVRLQQRIRMLSMLAFSSVLVSVSVSFKVTLATENLINTVSISVTLLRLRLRSQMYPQLRLKLPLWSRVW